MTKIQSNTDHSATQQIEIKNLDRSPMNVRKTDSKAALQELKASIIAHGLMQNLVVVAAKRGKYHVIAGGRRLAALQELLDEGKLPADHAVPCQIAEQEQAEEMSLAENVVRQAMHPADEFEAFAELIAKGQTAEHVATRFGVTRRTVEGRMKLAKVAPALIQAYRSEGLTLEKLMAFTVTDDHQRQLSVFEGLNDWDEADDIRNSLTEEMAEADDKRVRFVTLETYQKAGGTIKTDLFGEDVYLENPELLEALVAEKLKLVEQELTAEGWGWVKVDRERDWKATQGCSRIQPESADAPRELLDRLEKLEAEQVSIGEQIDATEVEDEIERLNDRDSEIETKLDELAELIAAHAKYNPEAMKSAGCYAYIGHKGELDIERGLVKREDAKKPAKGTGESSKTEAELPPESKGMSQSLLQDLAAYRLGVAQAEIAKHPAIAFDLLVFKAAKSALTTRSFFDGPQVTFTRNFAGTASKDARDFVQEQMDPVGKSLPSDWLESDSEIEQFAGFQALSTEQKHALLAYCVALTLQPKLDEGKSTAYDIALSQTGANVADYWRPTKDNFLSRINREQLLTIGKEVMLGGTEWANAHRDDKKGTLVDILDKTFAVSSKPDTRDAIKNWLPMGMEFRAVAQPTEQVEAPKKSRKTKAA